MQFQIWWLGVKENSLGAARGSARYLGGWVGLLIGSLYWVALLPVKVLLRDGFSLSGPLVTMAAGMVQVVFVLVAVGTLVYQALSYAGQRHLDLLDDPCARAERRKLTVFAMWALLTVMVLGVVLWWFGTSRLWVPDYAGPPKPDSDGGASGRAMQDEGWWPYRLAALVLVATMVVAVRLLLKDVMLAIRAPYNSTARHALRHPDAANGLPLVTRVFEVPYAMSARLRTVAIACCFAPPFALGALVLTAWSIDPSVMGAEGTGVEWFEWALVALSYVAAVMMVVVGPLLFAASLVAADVERRRRYRRYRTMGLAVPTYIAPWVFGVLWALTWLMLDLGFGWFEPEVVSEPTAARRSAFFDQHPAWAVTYILTALGHVVGGAALLVWCPFEVWRLRRHDRRLATQVRQPRQHGGPPQQAPVLPPMPPDISPEPA